MSDISDKLVIATTTFYNHNLPIHRHREDLAKETVRKSIDLGYEVCVVDGGSADEFLKELETCGAHIFEQKERGFGPGVRQAVQESYNIGRVVIGWTEPEKVSYIDGIINTVKPIVEEKADIVVPERTSLESYPEIQKYTELMGNSFFKEITGYAFDMWFGPKTFTRESSNYILSYDGRYGDVWDAIHVPVTLAIKEGKRVMAVKVDYTHPQIQKEDEEHDVEFNMKRITQLENMVNSFKKCWKN